MQMFKWFFRFLTGQAFTLHVDSGGGGGGGGGGNTTSTGTTYTTNIPEYARPYVETMLGATQQQLFDTTKNADTGAVEITGIKPYQAYGGTYDLNKTIADPNDPTQQIDNPNYGKQLSYDVNKYFAAPNQLQQTAARSAMGFGPSAQNDIATQMAGASGIQALNTQYNPMFAGTQNFGMRSAQQYMNPYAMSAMAPTLQEQARQSAIQGQQLQAKAVGQGAFGGSRQALEQSENARNLGMLQNKTMTEGMNTAYQNAMAQFNQDQARNLQAQQANIGQQQFGANLGMQGLSTALNAANQLGNLGQNQYSQQLGAINLQNTIGGQQQQAEQAKINQSIQDYATQQQWGMQQLANMNAMLRGLPLQNTTTQTYQAAPSAVSQLAGLGTAAVGAAKLAAKSGGSVRDIKRKSGLDDLGMYNATK